LESIARHSWRFESCNSWQLTSFRELTPPRTQNSLNSAGFPLSNHNHNQPQRNLSSYPKRSSSDNRVPRDRHRAQPKLSAYDGRRRAISSSSSYHIQQRKSPPRNAKSFPKLLSCFIQKAGSLRLLCVPKSLCKRFGFRI